jgi:hypothetical protein
MIDLDSCCEKCERDIEQLRGKLDALRLQMIDLVEGVLARVEGVLARVGEVFAKVEVDNRQMFPDLQVQTKTGFADLQASIINALPLALSQRKNDEPPKLN